MKWTTSCASDTSNSPSANGMLFGGRTLDPDARVPGCDRGDERLRWIDRRHGAGSEPPDELTRQRAGTAADVERALTGVYTGEVGEQRREQ